MCGLTCGLLDVPALAGLQNNLLYRPLLIGSNGDGSAAANSITNCATLKEMQTVKLGPDEFRQLFPTQPYVSLPPYQELLRSCQPGEGLAVSHFDPSIPRPSKRRSGSD